MAGHSKWANIKRKKEINDKARAKVFANLSRLITMAVIEGNSPDPTFNVKLRLVIEKAKENNMPKDNIQRAIEKGSGPNSAQLKEIKYEAFGPGGIGLLILGSTDNPKRTFAAVKNTTERNEGKIASPGAVSYLFEQCGTIAFDTKENKEEDLLAFAEKVEALDMEQIEESMVVYFPFNKLGTVNEAVGTLKVISSPEGTYRPLSTLEINSADEDKLITLIEALEELDDVQEVFTNANFS